jgi:hypothetical protein
MARSSAHSNLGQGGISVRVMEAFLGKSYAGLTDGNQQTMEQRQRFRAGEMAMVAETKSTAPNAG